MTPEYFEALCESMALLSQQPNVIFMGQSVGSPGTAMYETLRDVPQEKRLELPVFECCQMGMATGIAIAGGLPICIYPRINFMLEALPQLIQHLDKIPLFSDYHPKVIIRTAVATSIPLDAGVQHLGDYTYGISKMLSTVKIVKIKEAKEIVPAYRAAMDRELSTILVEDYRE